MGFLSTIFGAVSSVASPYLMYITLAGFIGLASVTGVFWFEKNSAEKTVATLTITNDRLNSTIVARDFTIASNQRSITALQDTNTTLTDNAAAESLIQQEIANAPATENAPVAPVLDRTIRSISRMRHPAKRAAH